MLRILRGEQTFQDWAYNLAANIEAAEAPVTRLIAGLVPWLAPAIPAYITQGNLIEYLGFSLLMSWVTAGIVEFLGLATVNNALSLWKHNRKYENSLEKNGVPFGLALFSFVVYLLVLIVVNAILEAVSLFPALDAVWVGLAHVLARLLLTLLTIPAALTIATAVIQRDIVQSLKRPTSSAPKVSKPAKSLQSADKTLPKVSKTKIKSLRTLRKHPKLLEEIAKLPIAQISQQYEVVPATAQEWKTAALEHIASSNGNG